MTSFLQEIHAKLALSFGIDLRTLALFRVGVALLILADLALRATDLTAHYSDQGVLPRAELVPGQLDLGVYAFFSKYFYSVHLLSGAPWFQALLFVTAGIAAICLLIGYQTRIVVVISWYLLISLHMRNTLILNSGDVILRVILFWSMFLPLGARHGLDAYAHRHPQTSRTENGPAFSPATVAILLQIALVYWVTVWLKTDPVWRTEGTAVYYAMSIDRLATPFGQSLLNFPGWMRAMTHFTLWFEVVGPLLMFTPVFRLPIRMVLLATFIGFHAGLGLCLTLGVFPFICMLAWCLFIPAEFWAWLSKKQATSAYKLALWPQTHGLWPWLHSRLPQPIAPVRRPGLGTHLIVGGLLLHVVLWNIRTLDYETYLKSLREDDQPIGSALMLEQHWRMFAPYPFRTHGWWVIPGVLADRTEVDVFRGEGPVSYEKPDVVSASYKNIRWSKYFHHLRFRAKFEPLRQRYAAYLCTQWNANHRPSRRLEAFRVIYIQRETPPPGMPWKPARKLLAVEHQCPATGGVQAISNTRGS